jgi:hypothetical protein
MEDADLSDEAKYEAQIAGVGAAGHNDLDPDDGR